MHIYLQYESKIFHFGRAFHEFESFLRVIKSRVGRILSQKLVCGSFHALEMCCNHCHIVNISVHIDGMSSRIHIGMWSTKLGSYSEGLEILMSSPRIKNKRLLKTISKSVSIAGTAFSADPGGN